MSTYRQHKESICKLMEENQDAVYNFRDGILFYCLTQNILVYKLVPK